MNFRKDKLFVGLMLALVAVTVLTPIGMAAGPTSKLNPAHGGCGGPGERPGPAYDFDLLNEGAGSDAMVWLAAMEAAGPGPGRGGGSSEVIAVGDASLTIRNQNGDEILVHITSETTIKWVETQTEGSLGDIQVGDRVKVLGRRNEDGSMDALAILVLPDGDEVGGRVTAIDGTTITVRNREGVEATVVTNADTVFRLGGPDGAEGDLSDVAVDKMIKAFGVLAEDGHLDASLVFINEGGPHGPGPGLGRPGIRGEVTAVNAPAFTLHTCRGDELTILTNDATEYRARDGRTVSFADIQVGIQAMVHGEPVEGQSNTWLATVVGIE